MAALRSGQGCQKAKGTPRNQIKPEAAGKEAKFSRRSCLSVIFRGLLVLAENISARRRAAKQSLSLFLLLHLDVKAVIISRTQRLV